MKISIVIATHGDERWSKLADERACPSAREAGAWETIIVHERTATLAEARNSGADMTTGEWLCFLDADDQLGDGYLRAMQKAMLVWNLWRPHDLLANPILLVPAVQFVRSDDEPRIPDWGQPIGEINCAVIGTLVSRALFFEVGGFRDYPMYEDWALWLSCVRSGARLVPVPDAVYCAHSTPEGRNSQTPVARQEAYWLVRNEHERLLAHGLTGARALSYPDS